MATCFSTNGIPSEVVSSKTKEFALQESKLFPASQKKAHTVEHDIRKRTFGYVCLAKIHTSRGSHAVLSESSLDT